MPGHAFAGTDSSRLGREAAAIPTSDAPEWWPSEATCILNAYRPLQHATLTDFRLVDDGGAPRFLDLRQVSSFLRRWVEAEPAVGDPIRLRIPTGYDDYAPLPVLIWRTQLAWRGWSVATCILEERSPSYAELRRQGALARLHDASSLLANETGCEPEEAVAFLLCDFRPSLPWIELRYDAECDAALIRVRHPEVPAREVAQAYRELRPGPMRYGGRVHQRRRRLWPERVETFVRQYRAAWPEPTWAQVWEAFRETYPSASEHYSGVRVFKQTFYDRTRPRPQKTLGD